MSRNHSSSHVPDGHPLSPPPEERHQPPQSPRRHRIPGDGEPPSSYTTNSPLLMSLSPQNQNYASSFSPTQTSPTQTSSSLAANTVAAAEHPPTSSSTSLSSPPSSFAMSTQTSHQPNSTSSSFPTPASSVNGQFMGPGLEENDGAMKDIAATAVSKRGGETMIKSEKTGADHMDMDASTQPNRTGERKDDAQTGDNAMDLDPKDNVLTNEPTVASLQTDIGQAFHVCKTSYTMSGPDPRLDLVSLYGLGPVAASVMRNDPVTGEKINKLRKSYEGKIKLLGLAGRNKPVKREPGAPGGLRQLTMWPEEEWYNQKVHGKEIQVAEPDSNLYKLQMRAMKFEPGPVPNNEYWEDVLGYEKPPKSAPTGVDPSLKKPSVSTPSFRQSGQTNGAPTAATPRADTGRPQRTGKKRSYTDDSFVGYADAFADDDDLEGSLYSNSDAGSSKKKRKKDHISGVPTVPQGGTYGVGMFVGR
ncbi:hypothetical protein VTO42DRAFT_1369 [Malbranchea cinnamomea]